MVISIVLAFSTRELTIYLRSPNIYKEKI
jgi:hypothetical protein